MAEKDSNMPLFTNTTPTVTSKNSLAVMKQVISLMKPNTFITTAPANSTKSKTALDMYMQAIILLIKFIAISGTTISEI